MDPAQLPQLEQLCQTWYQSGDAAQRNQAEQALRPFAMSTEYIPHCKAILDGSQSSFAQHFACSTLLKVVTDHALSNQVRLEMKQYFLSYLDSRGSLLEQFVVTALVRLLCRTVKLGWMDDDKYRAIVDDAKLFLDKGTPQHYMLGLTLLSALVSEMNQPIAGRTLTQHRKVAVAFRDSYLYKIFQMALLAMTQLKDSPELALKKEAVNLALQCLSFDFVGTCLDESAEELGTIQVPASWRPTIQDPTTLQLFLDYYAASNVPPLSNLCLECMVKLASVRRSLFANESERTAFLNALVAATCTILRTQQGLHEHKNYHEFCRLLGRLKTNYQLSELVSVNNYMEWIELVAQLTINSLQSWQWASSSVYYLLGLWSRLVSSMPYLKGDSPSRLESTAPQITQAYITSRLDSVQAVLMNEATEDPLENEDQLQDQLDSLPYLCRFQYDNSCKYICGLMDPLIQQYEAAGSQPGQDSMQLQLLDGRLAWMTYIIAAVVRGRLSTSSGESQEPLDGELSARVFRLVQLMDTGYHTTRYSDIYRQRLDMAVLSFFQHFRKVYIGEQIMHQSKVYTQLNEKLRLRDHLMVLNVIVTKIATNLKVYTGGDRPVELSLALFQDLAVGYMSGKLLLSLDSVKHLLQHHTSEQFSFLSDDEHARNRTTFYETLGRLLFAEDILAKFKAFVIPLQNILQQLQSMTVEQLRSQVPKAAIVGLFRDLRGIVKATNSRRTYGIVFDWLYPSHFPTMLNCLEAWKDTPSVTTPVLKFMSDFVLNKPQRIVFDASSPNGILLFREVSKMLVTYGNAVLRLTNVPDLYTYKYKGIWVGLLILHRALAGNYVNFGVFELYGDPALKDALSMSLQLCTSMPLTDILAYLKVAKAYYAYLEVLCQNHTATIAQVDNKTFTFLVTSLDAGLKSLDTAISSQCATAVDSLAGFFFKQYIAPEDGLMSGPSAAAQSLAHHLSLQPQLFPEILKTLFEIVLFEDCSNRWSLSRPMLTLILINEQIYADIKRQIINAQPSEKQAALATLLEKLMQDVQRSLDAKNKDKFTQNVTVVWHELKSRS